MFERTSPTLQITKIRAPVMHAYGGEDRNVDIANGEAVKKAFERTGLPVDYTFVPDEGHGYREDANVSCSITSLTHSSNATSQQNNLLSAPQKKASAGAFFHSEWSALLSKVPR